MGTKGGLRLNRKPESDAKALRDARLKKFEAFHGTGRSMNGDVSETPVRSISSTPAAPTVTEPAASTKTKPFEGSGRKLR